MEEKAAEWGYERAPSSWEQLFAVLHNHKTKEASDESNFS